MTTDILELLDWIYQHGCNDMSLLLLSTYYTPSSHRVLAYILLSSTLITSTDHW